MSKTAKARQKSEVSRAMPIDPHFHADIVAADVGIIAFLGRDFELSTYALTPSVRRMWGSTAGNVLGPAKIESDIVHRETARIRMGSATVAHLALNLAMALKEHDSDVFEQFLGHIRKYSGDSIDVEDDGESPEEADETDQTDETADDLGHAEAVDHAQESTQS